MMNNLGRTMLSIALLASGTLAFAQNETAEGKKQFEAQCKACHTLKPGVNGFGPSLAGVVGRRAGKAPGYSYTAAMSNSGLTWDEATLDAFLTSTMRKVPGTSMPLAISDARVRSAIIAYLKSVSATTAEPSARVGEESMNGQTDRRTNSRRANPRCIEDARLALRE
jgi:cytochrome c2